VAEQERLLKVKHLTDRRIGQLSGEIDSMKGAKVPTLFILTSLFNPQHSKIKNKK